ncbi:hypothetical protein WJX73_008816 [Symbiochloris irregularis]|uniref:HVA22-like protein n=1 Tax=Symbiochloris irregularis TaxID=706552 RepID=A0AAW1NPE5_9CHLO
MVKDQGLAFPSVCEAPNDVREGVRDTAGVNSVGGAMLGELVIAVFTAAERLVLDWTIFWLPLYYEGKLLFVVWLWHSHTQGAQYLYSKVLLPLLNKYEGPIDDSIAEAQTWLMDNFWQYARRKAGWQTATQQTAVSESG